MKSFETIRSKITEDFKRKGAERRINPRELSKRIKSRPFLGVHENELVIESLAHLVSEIKDKIGEYDTILSDDTSGRLVSLLLRKIINKKRTELEKDHAQTYFLVPTGFSKSESMSAIEKFISAKKGTLGKTLVVTEYIRTGSHMMSLIEILNKHGIDFDIATVSIARSPRDPSYSRELTNRLKYGSVGNTGRDFWTYKEFTGVKRSIGEESAHPVLNRDFLTEEAEEEYKELRRVVRDDVNILAEELSKLVD